MEVQGPCRQRGYKLVMDIRVEGVHCFRALVARRDASRPAKRHSEVAVKSFYRRTVQERRLIDVVNAQIQAEEIADGHFDARLSTAVPIHAKHDFLQVI